jgi:hypothetical protein
MLHTEFLYAAAVHLVMDRVAKRPRGFAFLSYADEGEAKAAMEGMHGKVRTTCSDASCYLSVCYLLRTLRLVIAHLLTHRILCIFCSFWMAE